MPGQRDDCAMYRDEKEAQAALASNDPIALCRLGWHEHESVIGRRIFFKYHERKDRCAAELLDRGRAGRVDCVEDCWLGLERHAVALLAVATCPNLSIGPPTGRNRVGD